MEVDPSVASPATYPDLRKQLEETQRALDSANEHRWVMLRKISRYELDVGLAQSDAEAKEQLLKQAVKAKDRQYKRAAAGARRGERVVFTFTCLGRSGRQVMFK